MTKLSVSIPDELVAELRARAGGNVSRFITTAVRDALDRSTLGQALDEMEEELGPVPADLISEAAADFDGVVAANRDAGASSPH